MGTQSSSFVKGNLVTMSQLTDHSSSLLDHSRDIGTLKFGTNMTFNSGFKSIEYCNIYIVKENQTRQPNANIARERFHKAGE